MDKKFTLEQLFTASTGDVDLQQKDVNDKGTFFINSGIENRGIKGRTDRRARIFPPNTITIDFWGNAYYRDFEYKMATHNHVFSLSGEVIKDDKVGLYLATVLSKLSKQFSYDNMATWNKLKTISILLPVIENPNPDHEYTVDDIDWQYMHDRITELERERITELDAYLQATGLDDYELNEDDKKVLTEKIDTKKFIMHDIFEPLPVKKAVKANVRNYQDNEFCIPVVYAKFGDNGIMYWGRKGEFTTYSNVLSIVYNGVIAAGKCYAQEDETGILAESYLIRYKFGEVPFLANLYMSKVIEHKIYPLYSRETLAIWNNRVENDIIELPVKSDGSPDFDYMERYIRAIEKVVIADVVKYKDKIIKATRTVVSSS